MEIVVFVIVGLVVLVCLRSLHSIGSTNDGQFERAIPPQQQLEPQKAQVLTGPAYITDGDSLKIRGAEVPLFGIDAPELHHPYGIRAKRALYRLCKGHDIRAEIIATDDYGRQVAKCSLPDGRDLSAEMVKLGLAIDWPKFSGGVYRHLEVAGARRMMYLADARQKGRMHVWAAYDARRAANKAR